MGKTIWEIGPDGFNPARPHRKWIQHQTQMWSEYTGEVNYGLPDQLIWGDNWQHEDLLSKITSVAPLCWLLFLYSVIF